MSGEQINEDADPALLLLFSRKLRTLRKQSALTQEELGKKLGIDKRNISMYENGKAYPHHKTLIKLTEVFRVTLEELANGEVQVPKIKRVLLEEATVEEIVERLHAMNIQPTLVFVK